jgi:ABC-type multidrug transport system ATPase subunit
VFVRLSGLSFSYSDSVSTLSDVTLTLALGWTGVVGPNGAGKTTMLRLIAGDLEPTFGQVYLEPPRGVIRACAQTVESLTPEIAAFACRADGVARRIHGELRLDGVTLMRWPTLSPGERKRWQVGAALGATPAVLMLDEPTDHLDVEARELLIASLERFRGIGIVVSHDRTLLDRITRYTVRVHDGTARIWRGSYSAAKRAWEAEERERHADYERLKHQRESLTRRLADRRLLQAAAAANTTRKRMKGPKDHDATGMMAKGQARAGLARQSHEVGILRREVDRVLERLGEYKFRKATGSVAVLLGATIAVAAMSEILVRAIEPVALRFGWTQLFIGVVVVAVVGNAAEHTSAIVMATKDKMDLSLQIAIGSATQIAMFVAPVLVFASAGFSTPMNLVFNPFELTAIILSVLIVNQIVADGETNWFEGLQLLVAYAILATAFFLYE